jgi:hypothetical protein
MRRSRTSPVDTDTDFREVGRIAVDRVGLVVRIIEQAADRSGRLETLRGNATLLLAQFLA